MMPLCALADKSSGRANPAARGRGALASLLGALVALAPVMASAHAIVVAATPAVNARIAPGALQIRLQLNSRIDRDRSRLTLRGPDGAERPVGLSRDAPPGVLAGQADATIAGPWTLRWQVLSVDGHITRGEIPFVVGEGQRAP